REAFVQIPHHKPEVIVVDLHLPDGSGLEIIAWARALSQQMGIVALTFSSQPEHILACMQSGASAHVSKSAPIAELVEAIEKSVLNPLTFSTRRATDLISKRNEEFGLTSRELEILEILPTGDTVAEMASRLFVSEATIKSHLAAIYRKLKAGNRVQAINAARGAGLLPK
ncbi:MAG: LuxR C-terminal-related transcriptional regulator, partial [Actinomycetota bacterium]